MLSPTLSTIATNWDSAPVHKYVGRWSKPPRLDFLKGKFPDGPILGNGDLGVTVGANLSQGELSVYFGLNQLWGIRMYDRQADPTFFGDTVFPRRLGFGKLTISSRALSGANFHADQVLATGSVHASIATPGANLSVSLSLEPASNVAVMSVAASAPLNISVTSSVLALRTVCRNSSWGPGSQHWRHCDQLDGTVDSGATGATIYSQRQPLGLSSPRPISVAMATHVGRADGLGDDARCTRAPLGDPGPPPGPQHYTGVASCAARLGAGQSLLITSALVTNFDLCERTTTGCSDPLPAALALAKERAADASATAARSAQWWREFWEATWIATPGDPLLEQFYYGTSYMFASASRTRKNGSTIATGLWGPWVHTDYPLWEGDYTLDYNQEANFWGLYANNRLDQAWPQYQPLLDFVPRARATARKYFNCPGLHFPGHIVPWGFDSSLAGEPWAEMSIQSNGVFAALNMIQHWEYTRDRSFLQSVAFPFARDTLGFYQCWMSRRPDGSWVNVAMQELLTSDQQLLHACTARRIPCTYQSSVRALGWTDHGQLK